MKRLIFLLLGAFHFWANAQSFAVRNMNDDYVTADLYSKNFTDKAIYKIVKDNTGLYWFQGVFDLFSFDGVNWRTYHIKSFSGKSSPIRINDIELVHDSIVLLGTSTGIYLLDRPSEMFVPLTLKFPGIKGLPLAVSSFYQAWDDQLAFTSQLEEGFYLLDWSTQKLDHIYIDKDKRTELPDGKDIVRMTSDKNRISGELLLITGGFGIMIV